MIITTKKKLCELFYNYTEIIYRECGRPLSQKQKTILKNRINGIAKKYTLKEKIKGIFKKCKK